MWRSMILLILHSWITVALSAAAKESATILDLAREPSLRTIEHDGKTLQVFGTRSLQFAEPSIQFERPCLTVEYNAASMQYQIEAPVKITANTLLGKQNRSGFNVDFVKIFGVEVEADPELVGTEANQVRVRMKLLNSSNAVLLFLCPSSARCQQVQDAVQADPSVMQQNVRIFLLARVGLGLVKFPAADCNVTRLGKCDVWIPFLARANGNFSFARGWRDYVAGFGSSDYQDYWMGLEALHLATNRQGFKCQVRIEALSAVHAMLYWEEWSDFRIAGPQVNYTLHVGKLLQSSGEHRFANASLGFNNGFAFSTFDQDNDQPTDGSCANSNTDGGWWYSNCTFLVFTADQPKAAVNPNGLWLNLRRVAMLFKCL